MSTPIRVSQEKIKKMTFGNSEQLKKHSDIIAFKQMARMANRAFVPPATAANGSPQKSLQQRIQDGRRMARQSTTQQWFALFINMTVQYIDKHLIWRMS